MVKGSPARIAPGSATRFALTRSGRRLEALRRGASRTDQREEQEGEEPDHRNLEAEGAPKHGTLTPRYGRLVPG